MNGLVRLKHKILSSPMGLFAMGIILLLLSMALVPHMFTSYLPSDVNLQERLLAPSWTHLLGTDDLGRDVFSCVVYGARTTFFLLILSIALSAPLGMVLGICAGYIKPLQRLILRTTDLFLAFPRLVLAMMVPAFLGTKGWGVSVVAMALTLWPYYTRLACMETMRMKEMPFIHIVQMQGAGFFYVMRRHLLPFIFPSAIVRLTVDSSSVVLIGASLSFLGLGVSPDTPEWGALAAQGSRFVLTHIWVAMAPCFVIFLLSFSLQVLGDMMRDAWDPKH